MKNSQVSSIEASIFLVRALIASGPAIWILSVLAILCMTDQHLSRRLERIESTTTEQQK
jgi:hypothetical protein